MFSNTEIALERGYGLCLLYNDELVCDAFIGPSAAGLVEIGAESRPRHRHKGDVSLTCRHLIQAIEQKGFRTYWNCAKSNHASIALAHKLGYQLEKEYRLTAWSKWDA
jgi:RimJ/RimL family protein N-acetyltransferase